jgi:putative heme-binding domain-containing protein
VTKQNFSVFFFFSSGAVFIGVSIATAISMVSTPVTVQVVAPLAIQAVTGNDSLQADDDGSLSLLAVAQDSNQPDEQRAEAIEKLAARKGTDRQQGVAVFKKHCIACHKIQGEGADYAPDLSEVASRLTRQKIVESIVHPSAMVEEKYRTTMILTLDGDVFTGLLIEKNDLEVKLFDSKEMQTILVDDIEELATKTQSSMPEKLPDAMAAGEFLNLIEYLSSLTKAE